MIFKATASVFIRTKAYNNICKAMKKNNIITICGPLGCGKKCLAHKIALEFSMTGYEIVPIYDCQEFFQCYNQDKKQLFVIDDPLGKSCLDTGKLSVWSTYHDDIQSCFQSSTTTKAIFTCRSLVMKSENCRQKCRMLYQHEIDLNEGKFSWSKRDIKRLASAFIPEVPSQIVNVLYKRSTAALPLLLKTAKELKITDVEDAKKVSLQLFKSELCGLINQQKSIYDALLLVMLSGNSFHPGRDTHAMMKALSQLGVNIEEPSMFILDLPNLLREMEGSFLIEQCGAYSFANELFYDLLTYRAALLAPKFTIGACSTDFFLYRISLPSDGSSTDVLLNLNEDLYDAWFERFVLEIKNGHFLRLLLSPVFSGLYEYISKRFATIPLDRLKEVIQAESCNGVELSDDVPRNVCLRVKSLEPTGNLVFLYGIIMLGHFELFQTIWKRLKKERLKLLSDNSSLLKAVLISGDVKMLEFFSEKVIKKNSTLFMKVFRRSSANVHLNSFLFDHACLCITSECNHMEMTKYLLDFGLEVNQDNEKGETPLFIAAKYGNIDIMEFLISRNANINVRTKDGLTPLMSAIANDQDIDVILLLLHGEADVTCSTQDKETALTLACYRGDPKVVQAIINAQTKAKRKEFVKRQNLKGVSALYRACQLNNDVSNDIVWKLLLNSADPNVCDNVQNSYPIHAASLKNNSVVVHFLLIHGADVNAKDKDGVTAFFISTENGFLKVSLELIRNNCDVSIKRISDGATPLLIAAEKGHLMVVNLILKKDKTSIDEQNYEDSTPLLLATLNNNTKVCEALLNFGANVNISNKNGYNPTLVAARNGNTKLLHLFISEGGDVNCKSTAEGYTPLHLASMMGNMTAVRYLLANGADVNETDKNNYSPLALALCMKQTKVGKILHDFSRFGVAMPALQTPSIQNPRTQSSFITYSDDSSGVTSDKEIGLTRPLPRRSIASSSASSSVYSDSSSGSSLKL